MPAAQKIVEDLAATGLEALYVDDALLVLNKPSGLLSVPGLGEAGRDCLIHRAQAHCPDALTVHRLDMETSGLIVLARSKATHRALSLAFQNRQVGKRYVAIVDGQVGPEQGEIDLPLIADWPNRPRQKVDFEVGKPSLTRYCVLHRTPDRTRLELRPETGRSHQLRVHLQSIGHAILGDALYAPPAARNKSPRLLLHATELVFQHPLQQQMMTFSSSAPF
ncbi:MAG: RluA family pseudouridine synthase [Betaproteobacteria bacterium]